jgi:predicted transcriptional regulator YheO
MSASRKRRTHHPDRTAGAEGDDLVVRKVTGKELNAVDELSARLTTLVEMLDEKGILDKKEYGRMVAMRLHEISKAGAIEELDEEL